MNCRVLCNRCTLEQGPGRWGSILGRPAHPGGKYGQGPSPSTRQPHARQGAP